MIDISDYFYFLQILVAFLIFYLIVIFSVRIFPGFWDSFINVRYGTFKSDVVLADVLSITLATFIGYTAGLILTRYIK